MREMGWEHLLSGFLAGLIVDKHEKKKKASAGSSFGDSSSPIGAAVAERQYINTRNKTIIATYQPIPTAWFDDPDTDHELLPTYLLDDSDVEKLRSYYTRVEVNPNSIEARTTLIHFLYKLYMDDGQICFVPLLQNELLYLIDYYTPRTEQEEMFRHLAMFISAECYFFNGELALAMKRLYQTLDWQAIFDNSSEKDGIDFNGLSAFHEAVVVNIINIYALAGLPEKANNIRAVLRRMVNDRKSFYAGMQSDYLHNDNLYEYARDCSAALMAANKFQGYYLLSVDSYRENLFKESCTAIIRDQPIYSIECSFYSLKDMIFKDCDGIYDDVQGMYPTLIINYKGSILNYPACINRDLDELRNM